MSPKTGGARASVARSGAAAVIIIAMLLAADVARLTVATEFVETRPQLASSLAPLSPVTLASTAMAQVGEAAAQGGDPSQATFDLLRRLAATAPLQPEPFLVQAALAQRAGDYARAEALLMQARMRAPRSAAARYLLAEVWVRQGKVVQSLREIAILARILPNAEVQLVPALAEYARTSGARDELGAILAENPRLKQPLLEALATDPDNADLVVALAGDTSGSTDWRTQRWQSRLVRALVERGDYDRAYAFWRQFAGPAAGPRPLLFNGDFRRLAAPPPFNWEYSSARSGLAEPDNGRLRILYFGRRNTPLASQLLLLPAGTYRFEAPTSGNLAPGSLAWTVTCLQGKNQIMELRPGGSTTPAATFTVPGSGCGAQWLELKGRAQDMPQESDVRIGPVRLDRVGA